MRVGTSVEQRKDLESLTHLQPLTPPLPPSCPLAGRFRVLRTQTALLNAHEISLQDCLCCSHVGAGGCFKADQSCGVNSISSTSCFSCLFVSVLQHNASINLLLFLNVVSGSGIGASGSCSALVSVGQKLCEAGGIRQCIGSCSTCSEGLNTDASR